MNVQFNDYSVYYVCYLVFRYKSTLFHHNTIIQFQIFSSTIFIYYTYFFPKHCKNCVYIILFLIFLILFLMFYISEKKTETKLSIMILFCT